jgi:polysaccharide export outer membrane protein
MRISLNLLVSRRDASLGVGIGTLLAFGIAGCSQFPTSGPSAREVQQVDPPAAAGVIQMVELDDRTARQLKSQRQPRLFSEVLGQSRPATAGIGRGDTLEVNIWEAPPATLFGAGAIDLRAPSAARAATFPEIAVDAEGSITVPFAGVIAVAGLTPRAVQLEIARRLAGKANQPEVLVRVLRNASSNVTVVGEVTSSVRMPLTPAGERLLDALAAAGGVRLPVNKMTIQVTRGAAFYSLPLDRVIQDPAQNVPLSPGDVVTAMYQPFSFTALGATGKNEEVSFEAQGISLAQALARVGGLLDTRSNPEGVFIFRFEPRGALEWPRQPAAATADGLVPVVYRLNLRDPSSFFVMQDFPISNKDLLYVSNAPAAELQKFLNVVFSIAYPVLTAIQAGK